MTLEEVYNIVRHELCWICRPEMKEPCENEEVCHVFQAEIKEAIANNELTKDGV